MTPTHILKLADGYGSTKCELIVESGPLATVRINGGAYWEAARVTTRVVRVACLQPIPTA